MVGKCVDAFNVWWLWPVLCFVCLVFSCVVLSCLVLLQVFAEGDEEDEDGDADEPPAPVVKLRGKKVSTTPHHTRPDRGGRACRNSVVGCVCCVAFVLRYCCVCA